MISTGDKCIICGEVGSGCVIMYEECGKKVKHEFHYNCEGTITDEMLKNFADLIKTFTEIKLLKLTRKRLLKSYKEMFKPLGFKREGVHHMKKDELKAMLNHCSLCGSIYVQTR